MKTNSIKIKNEILMFVSVNFIITFSMGIVMFFVYKYIDKAAISDFALVQMFYPALTAVILMINNEKNNIDRNLIYFFKIYIVLCILSMIVLLTGVSDFPQYISKILYGLICAFSIAAFYLIFNNRNNCFEKIGMVLQKNFKNVFILCLIFIGIEFVIAILNGFIYGNFIENVEKSIKLLEFLPFNLLLGILISFISFFGEEFGWRGYLQPRLQVLFGKKLGVIILGPIWGLWHLPLCFMLYSPKTPVYCLIFHIFYCTFIGIFLGLVYMKTGNLWSTIIVHLINNYMASGSGNANNIVFTPEILILNIAVCGIAFLPFIFTKEYRKKSSRRTCEFYS